MNAESSRKYVFIYTGIGTVEGTAKDAEDFCSELMHTFPDHQGNLKLNLHGKLYLNNNREVM